MDRHKQNRDNAEDFTTFLYQKGYRGQFALLDERGHRQMVGNLSECLRDFIKRYESNEHASNKLTLQTTVTPVKCTFQAAYNQVTGFLIRHFTAKEENTAKEKSYPIQWNNQVPGAQAIHGLFPKPKPWEQFMKGKRFRP